MDRWYEISLGFAYVVIPLSFECNDARYFRVRESFPIATFGGLQISLKMGKAIRNLKQMFVSNQESKTSGKQSVEILSCTKKKGS